jgi:hypothetical protein
MVVNKLRSYYPAIIASVVLVAAVLLLYPFCSDFIDPDATGYLTISKRYAAGDYLRAINGYWSPWSCWLSALLVKPGMAVYEAALTVNVIGAIGVLLVMQSFALAFRLHVRLQWFLSLVLSLFLSYAVYKQLFDDVWECLFLLLSLRMLCKKDYSTNPRLWLLNGVIGGLAFFSKAYAVPFFALNTAGCSYIILHSQQGFAWRKWLKMTALPVLVMLVLGAPWIYALYVKYGEIMTATAGKLNLSWYLVGHPIFADGIGSLLPPPYDNSPYYWEDPYLVNGATPHFYSSAKLFALQLVKIGYNFLKLVNCMNELSALYMFTWLVGIYILFSKKRILFADRKAKLVAYSFLLFPLGFILINYESRYIWYTMPLSMLIGMMAIQKLATMFNIARRMAIFLAVVFSCSYLFWPAWDLRNVAGYGDDARRISSLLQKFGIQGSFAINTNASQQVRVATQVAYRTGSNYYNMPFEASFTEILKEMRRYHVKYYFYHFKPADHDFDYNKLRLLDEQGKPFPEFNELHEYGWKIFIINP